MMQLHFALHFVLAVLIMRCAGKLDDPNFDRLLDKQVASADGA